MARWTSSVSTWIMLFFPVELLVFWKYISLHCESFNVCSKYKYISILTWMLLKNYDKCLSYPQFSRSQLKLFELKIEEEIILAIVSSLEVKPFLLLLGDLNSPKHIKRQSVSECVIRRQSVSKNFKFRLRPALVHDTDYMLKKTYIGFKRCFHFPK